MTATINPAIVAKDATIAAAPRRKSPVTLGRVLIYVLLGVGGLFMVAPFIWMVLTSFKAPADVNTFSWLPITWHPENYPDAFNLAPFVTYFRNSIIVVVGQTVPTMILSSAAGYALARLPVRGADRILNYFIILLVIPFQILIIPLFLVVRAIPLAGGNDILGQGGTGWINTFFALIVPFITSPIYVFLARQFFVSLPTDLADAARVDGVSEVGIFFRIMAPLAKPAFVTIALFSIEAGWNGFIWPLVATSSLDLRPIQFGLASFVASASGAAGEVQWSYLMAIATLAMLPMILLFVFGQRFFIQGVATAGLKG
ncbi:carbohydrate ABC transporter permease (plasmid) [Glaciihabitans sp. INWT7]|uniref:carbohydrate ABC transporter permease n=1 Tax=Glaciihabitans sp. INWT7 TaxID=2596912 RepID=UPI0016299791|nr:carbohydrate ABC transporter permease [Glaciihabitans sp. INWT7]QNE48636.1 carbohydrate ABC transporter permease [Glaciihabitans sp. INWT7]